LWLNCLMSIFNLWTVPKLRFVRKGTHGTKIVLKNCCASTSHAAEQHHIENEHYSLEFIHVLEIIKETWAVKKMRPVMFAAGLGVGAVSYLCIHVVKKLNRTAQQLLVESRQNAAKLESLVVTVEQLSEEVSKLCHKLNTCDPDVISKNVPHPTIALRESTKIDVRSWTVAQVQQSLFNLLASSSRFVTKEEKEQVSTAFAKVDGVSLEDLVYDDSHGIGLEQKLSFMGLSTDLVAIISAELHRLCPPQA